MNKNVATFLCINHAQLTDLRSIVPRHMKQSTIPDLSSHFGVKGRLIENDIQLTRFLAWQHRLHNSLCLEKVIPQKFCWLRFQFALFNADLFLLLRLSRPRRVAVPSISRIQQHQQLALAPAP